MYLTDLHGVPPVARPAGAVPRISRNLPAVAAAFKSTMQLFTKWLYYGIGTMFSMAVMSFMVALVTKITLAVAAAMAVKWLFLLNFGGGGINAIAMQQGSVGLIMTILLISCPPMAAMFFNATVGQFSAYSQFGVERGGGQRDGAGNPVVTGASSNQQSLKEGNPSTKSEWNNEKPSSSNQITSLRQGTQKRLSERLIRCSVQQLL